METENDGYDGYQYESNSQDGDSQYGDGITINKSIARHLTAKIIKTSPLQKENGSGLFLHLILFFTVQRETVYPLRMKKTCK